MNSEKALAMHLAASKNQIRVCEIFARLQSPSTSVHSDIFQTRYCGVDVHLGNQAGLTVTAVAILNGCVDLVRMLISVDASCVAYKG